MPVCWGSPITLQNRATCLPPATISFAWACWAVCLPRWKIWYIWCAICRRTPPGRPLAWGRATCPSLYAALALGGHIRVGLEDNVYLSKGVPATNVQLVERAVQAVRTFGKQPATPAQAREILGLKPLK